MRVVPLIFSYFLISEINAYALKKIEGIKNEGVTHVKFDADGNTYVVAKPDNSNRYRLYKLNPFNELTPAMDLPYSVSNIVVSTRGDIYLHSLDDVLATIPANSTEIKVIAKRSNKLLHLDNDGNLFFDKGSDDVYVLSVNSNASAPIKDLKSFGLDRNEWVVSDKAGNTYFLARHEGKPAIALVTKEALEDKIPSASFVKVDNGHTRQIVTNFEMDNDGILWITTSNAENSNPNRSVKKYSNGNLKTIRTDHRQGSIKIVPAKEGTYILENRGIYFVKPNDEVVKLKKLNSDFFWTKGLVSSEGHVYFFYRTKPNSDVSSGLGKLVAFKPDEEELISIEFGKYPKSVKSANLDFNGDVWVVTAASDDIFYLKKGETVPNVVSKNDEYQDRHVHVNFVTRKVYFASLKGLFAVENS